VVHHGVAAVLDHHLAAAELLEPRQRLRQHVRLVHGGERAQGRRGRGGPVHRGPLSAVLLRRRGAPLSARARVPSPHVRRPHAHDAYAECSSTTARDRSAVRSEAPAPPTPRSTRTWISVPDRSTSRAPGAPIPSTHTGASLNETRMRSGSRSTGAMPTAASTRPQLGSEPNRAVLTRLSRAITRAPVSA